MELNSNREGIEKQEQMYVYVLQLVDRTYYTGMTGNMKRRMKEHQNGESKSTLAGLPVKLIFLLRLNGRRNARNLEVRIKRRGAERWLNQLRFSPLRYEYDIQEELDEYN